MLKVFVDSWNSDPGLWLIVILCGLFGLLTLPPRKKSKKRIIQ